MQLFQERALLVIKHFGIQSNILTNKGFLTNENIAIRCNEEIITDTAILEDIFNTHYINILEKSSDTLSNIKGNPENPSKDSITVKNLFKEYENHPRIINIKNQNLAKDPMKLILHQQIK